MGENILYLCQGGMISVFNEAARRQKFGKAFAIVSDELAFERIHKTTVLNFDVVLKEWELTKNIESMTSTAKVDLPVDLKTAYYADRRLSYGPGSKFFEDYDRRYDEEQVTNLLYHSYLEIKSLVKRLNIDKVACFLPTTFLDVITLQVCDELDIKKQSSAVAKSIIMLSQLMH